LIFFDIVALASCRLSRGHPALAGGGETPVRQPPGRRRYQDDNTLHCPNGGLIALFVVLATFIAGVPGFASPQTASAQAAYEQALGLLQKGKNDEALAVIDSAIAAGASDPSLYNLEGLANSELGHDAEAEQSFRMVIRLSPNSAMGYTNLGVLLSKVGRHEDAATAFREAQTLEPKNFTALLGLGTSLEALHKHAEAAVYLQRAWEVHPGDFQAGYELALALREAKQSTEAKTFVNQIAAPQEPESAVKYYSLAGVVEEDLKEFGVASDFYRRAYAINPGSYEIYVALVRSTISKGTDPSKEVLPSPPENLSESQNLSLGILFNSAGAYPQAIPRFEEALRLDATNETATVNLALAYKNVGKTSAAIDLLRRAVKQRPSAALYNLLAGLDEESGEYVEAVQSFQRAVELDPNNERYYFDLGMEYLSHFTFGPAAEVYRVGTQKFPHSSRQYLGLAFSHYAVREYGEAADAFTTALEIDPESPQVFQAWKTVLSFLAPKDWDGLLRRLDRLAAAHPQNAELAFAYGAAMFRLEVSKGQEGAFDRPQTFLEKSVRLQPNFPEAHLELGALYAARKQDQKAVDEYLEAIAQDLKSEIAHYRLGQVYRDMNKMDLAKQELDRYQELSRLHQEELKESRSAVKQFVLSQGAKPSE
jgi:tetratricopeptide (TPR) repeat protein